MGRWLRPEVYPLLASLTFVAGIGIFQMGRHMVLNPEVRVSKKNRGTAVRENHAEGEKYAEHRFRKFLRNRPPEVMPNLNRFFSKDHKDD